MNSDINYPSMDNVNEVIERMESMLAVGIDPALIKPAIRNVWLDVLHVKEWTAERAEALDKLQAAMEKLHEHTRRRAAENGEGRKPVVTNGAHNYLTMVFEGMEVDKVINKVMNHLNELNVHIDPSAEGYEETKKELEILLRYLETLKSVSPDKVQQSMEVKLLDWNLKVDEEGQYLYITRNGQPGEIQVKAEAEGFVVDIYQIDGVDPMATAAVLYNDLKESEER